MEDINHQRGILNLTFGDGDNPHKVRLDLTTEMAKLYNMLSLFIQCDITALYAYIYAVTSDYYTKCINNYTPMVNPHTLTNEDMNARMMLLFPSIMEACITITQSSDTTNDFGVTLDDIIREFRAVDCKFYDEISKYSSERPITTHNPKRNRRNK